MQEVKGMEARQGELPALVEGQEWKLWLAGAMLAVAGVGFLMPDGIGRTLDILGVGGNLKKKKLCFASLGWAAYAVRCRHCRLRLVMYAMSHQSIGQWLHWLLAVKRCPKCGADRAGRRP